jgi:hypothetical protein
MSNLHLTAIDKKAICKNQQKLVNILGTSHLVEAYNMLSENNDYAMLIGIAPIFKKLSDAVEESDDYSCDYDLDDEINSVDEEIQEFFEELPTVEVNLDPDTFNKKYKSDELYVFKEEFTEELSFDELVYSLLDSEKLTKEEKTKIISIISNESREKLIGRYVIC